MAAGEEGGGRCGIGQPVGKAKQCLCRTREVGEVGGSGRRAGMYFGMTAAALLLEDLEEGQPYWEREKCSINSYSSSKQKLN